MVWWRVKNRFTRSVVTCPNWKVFCSAQALPAANERRRPLAGTDAPGLAKHGCAGAGALEDERAAGPRCRSGPGILVAVHRRVGMVPVLVWQQCSARLGRERDRISGPLLAL